MRLTEFSLGLLRRALAIYEEVAFQGQPCPQRPQLQGDDSDRLQQFLGAFEDETPRQENSSHRYVLRLGNLEYPFMKLVLEEHLIRGEFFLQVDTHDQMFKVSSAEREEVEQVRRHNAEIKRAIEERWATEGMPTVSHLKGLLETRPLPREERRQQRILLVDDDANAAETLSMLLDARGFDIELAANGAEALERADPGRIDLVIMDVEMPVMDGLESCRLLKETPETKGLPVLLATAGLIDLGQTHSADAFLVKPFQAEILFSFIDHLLSPPDRDQGGAGTSST